MKKVLLGLSLLSALVLGACSTNTSGDSSGDSSTEKLQVMTTFYPMYDFTKNIIGDEGDVHLLMPAGTDSHDYEPSAKDMASIQDADVFVYNNENMEMWVPSITQSLEEGNVEVIKATEGMLLLPGSDDHDHGHSHGEDDHDHDHDEADTHNHDEDDHDHEHEEDGHDHGEDGHFHELDPHVWISPYRAIHQVESIRDQLIAAYPEKEVVFTTNAANLLSELTALDQEYRDAFSQAKQTSFVTQHSAFGYLALDYGLTQVPIAGLSPNEEPSPARLAELKDFVTEHGVQYIYFEANAKDSIARTLASEANVELEVLNPLESLTQEDIDAGVNYLSVMAENLTALRKTTDTENPTEDDHDHVEEKEKTVYNGYFEDDAVQDRPLSDWAGEWRSVYPLLENGTLDQVFDYKAKQSDSKTAEEYKEYYTVGYQTDVKEINITDDSMEFIFDDGTSVKSNYRYAGKEILNYEAGNRGVRFLFEATDAESGAFKYVQFSDHSIEPTKSYHYHIYFGNESQEALIDEVDNWPTYYPADLSDQEIAQEMLAH